MFIHRSPLQTVSKGTLIVRIENESNSFTGKKFVTKKKNSAYIELDNFLFLDFPMLL